MCRCSGVCRCSLAVPLENVGSRKQFSVKVKILTVRCRDSDSFNLLASTRTKIFYEEHHHYSEFMQRCSGHVQIGSAGAQRRYGNYSLYGISQIIIHSKSRI